MAVFSAVDLMLPRLPIFLRVGLCLLLSALAAPKVGWAAATYGAGSGLPNLSVTAIARDADGMIWLGTEDGLVRFDGHRFIEVALKLPGTANDNYVMALLATPQGVYIATKAALLVSDGAQAGLQSIKVDGHDLADIRGLARDPAGHLYAATGAGQLWRWSATAPAPTPLIADQSSPPRSFTGLSIGPSAIWLAAVDGAYQFDPEAMTLQPLRIVAPELDNGARYAQAIIEFPRGTVWIGYWDDALLRVEVASGDYHWYHPGDADSAALRSTSIYALAATTDRLYIGSNRGIAVYHPECDCLRALNLPSWDVIDGSGIVAQALLAERDGVWAGVFGEGAVRFGLSDEAFHNQVRVNGRDDRLAHAMVKALSLDHDGRLWVGTYGGGVQSVDAAARVPGVPWTFDPLKWQLPRAEASYLWSLEQTQSGMLLGTGAGLYQRSEQTVIAIDPAERIRCTLELSDGRRYVGSMSGLFRITPDGLDRVDHAEFGVSPVVWVLIEHAQELWLGTEFGLTRLGNDERVLERIGIGEGARMLPGGVHAKYLDSGGRLWLGTTGGLVEVDESAGLAFKQPAPLQRARVRNVSSIEVDADGRFWLGTSTGLVRFVPGDGSVTRYAQGDGLFGNEFNYGASVRDGDRLTFGGTGGLVDFAPAELATPQDALQPRLTRLRVGRGPYLTTAELDLPARHEALQLEFSSGEYLHPESVRYALRWDGLSDVDTDLGDASSTVVERLPAGAHRLELLASRVDEPGSLRRATVLRVNVAKMWFETWWGRGAGLLGLVLAVLGFGQWRTRAARLQRARLEIEVGLRTRELNAATEALQRSNAQLQTMALIDPLTGLANRRRLFQQAEAWLASGRRLSVIMIDLDHFKACNDRYGHAHGDRVLQDFSTLFRAAFPDENQLCVRYGGEEFLCLCADANDARLEQGVQRLQQSVRAHRIPMDDSHEFKFTVSIGIAQAIAGEPIEATIRRADGALYQAKTRRDAHEWAAA